MKPALPSTSAPFGVRRTLVTLAAGLALAASAFAQNPEPVECTDALAEPALRKQWAGRNVHDPIRHFLQRASRAEFDAFKRGERTTLTSVAAFLLQAKTEHPDWVLVKVPMATRYLRAEFTDEEWEERVALTQSQGRAQRAETRRRPNLAIRAYVVALAENDVIVHQMGGCEPLMTPEQIFGFARRRFREARVAPSVVPRWLVQDMDPDLHAYRIETMARESAGRAVRTRARVTYDEAVREWIAAELTRGAGADVVPTFSHVGARAAEHFHLTRAIGSTTVGRVFATLPETVRRQFQDRQDTQTGKRLLQTVDRQHADMRLLVRDGVREELAADRSETPSVTTTPVWAALLRSEFGDLAPTKAAVVRAWLEKDLTKDEYARYRRGSHTAKYVKTSQRNDEIYQGTRAFVRDLVLGEIAAHRLGTLDRLTSIYDLEAVILKFAGKAPVTSMAVRAWLQQDLSETDYEYRAKAALAQRLDTLLSRGGKPKWKDFVFASAEEGAVAAFLEKYGGLAIDGTVLQRKIGQRSLDFTFDSRRLVIEYHPVLLFSTLRASLGDFGSMAAYERFLAQLAMLDTVEQRNAYREETGNRLAEDYRARRRGLLDSSETYRDYRLVHLRSATDVYRFLQELNAGPLPPWDDFRREFRILVTDLLDAVKAEVAARSDAE